MKFIHIADVHLGAAPDSNMPWSKSREKEIWNSFERIIDQCNEEQVDLLLIAGDLFHRQPLIRDLKEVNYLFQRLMATKVVLIAGNHDYIGARSNYNGFEWEANVHMLSDDTINFIYFPEVDTYVYGFSYCQRDILEPLYDEAKPVNTSGIHILLAHGGDERDIPINRKRLKEAGFHYVALGHIHKPELISDRMAYAGSLEPLDKNEIGERGYIRGDIIKREDYETKIVFVPHSIREYKRVSFNVNPQTTNGALFDQIREEIKNTGKQHIYQITIQGLRSEDILFDTEGISSLGNVIEILDLSKPDYDFEQLQRENADNIIGLFIQRIREKNKQDLITEKALYYGMEALLGARDK